MRHAAALVINESADIRIRINYNASSFPNTSSSFLPSCIAFNCKTIPEEVPLQRAQYNIQSLDFLLTLNRALPCQYPPLKLKLHCRIQLQFSCTDALNAFARNRSLSVRSKKDNASTVGSSGSTPKHRFTMASLRGMQQPELSKKLFKIIKSENHAIGAYESASRERISIASQLSDWGESTGDDSISDVSDKLGVLLSELGEQEDVFAQNLEDYRGILKQIRNTESSVQPSRNHKAKISDEIAKLKYKEPESTKIVQLEQELVRAEAQNLVAEAQLTNVVRLSPSHATWST